MTSISETTDYLHCFCRLTDIIFVPVGGQVITVAGEIKVDDTTCKEAGKLLYRGTGNPPVPFFMSVSKTINLPEKISVTTVMEPAISRH